MPYRTGRQGKGQVFFGRILGLCRPFRRPLWGG